jgi:hypothetical protein
MPNNLKIVLFVALVLAIGMVGTVFGHLFRRRTIAAWFGKGVNDDLSPLEASLVVGLHPGAMLALCYHHLNRLGQVKLIDETPITVEWCGPVPSGKLERAFQGAFDADGRLNPAGTISFLEVLYKQVNEKMLPYSGLQTALYYVKTGQELWDQMLRGDRPEPAAYPWLLLLDANDIWEQMGEGEDWEWLKAMHRVKARFRSDLLAMEEISKAPRRAKKGFFKYRRDLIRMR